MTPTNDRKRRLVALTELALATGREADEATLAVYLKHLSAVPDAELLAVLGRLTKSARFFPSVGQIIEALGECERLRVAEAWAVAVRIAGRGRYVDRDAMATPEIRESVRLIGGWDAIGLTHVEKLPFVEKRFAEIFPATSAKLATMALACEAAGVGAITQ